MPTDPTARSAAPEPAAPRVFLLSPAHCGGQRARMVLRADADFPLARRLREPPGAPLGEVFSFLSGLYFRGKLAYAGAFARPPGGVPGALVITPTRGFLETVTRVTTADLEEFAAVPIDAGEQRYRAPLEAAGREIAAAAGPECEVVLLGSIATGKYADLLLGAFGDRLRFPIDFVGRGDMSRGGLLLRCVDEGRELAYAPLLGAVRRGPRPPRLDPRR